jgi:hypothetical protein
MQINIKIDEPDILYPHFIIYLLVIFMNKNYYNVRRPSYHTNLQRKRKY